MYTEEITMVADKLEEKGFTYVSPSTRAGVLDYVLGQDESSITVRNADGDTRGILFILGNEPGIAICNYTCDDDLDTVSSEVNQHFDTF